jgi:hypothetical protein
MFENKNEIERALMALAEQLKTQNIGLIEIVVCGGAAMNVLGYVHRSTEDIDIVAFIDHDAEGKKHLTKAEYLMDKFFLAVKRVARDFVFTDNWLNCGPSSIMDFGLPDGLMDRVETRSYGVSLTVHFLTRYDQIHFKLYAAVDRGGTHVDDLLALNPTAGELEKAALWSMTHDPSDGYAMVLRSFLIQLGYQDVAKRL